MDIELRTTVDLEEQVLQREEVKKYILAHMVELGFSLVDGKLMVSIGDNMDFINLDEIVLGELEGYGVPKGEENRLELLQFASGILGAMALCAKIAFKYVKLAESLEGSFK